MERGGLHDPAVRLGNDISRTLTNEIAMASENEEQGDVLVRSTRQDRIF